MLRPPRLVLLPVQVTVPLDEVRHLGAGQITVADCYVGGAERGEAVPGGYAVGRVLNVDHHAPTARMARAVSSTNLALAHLAAGGTGGEVVAINHTDCDSVLSAALLRGQLEADPVYGASALAADHTGAPDPVADLLQALDDHRRGQRRIPQWIESLDNLQRLGAGRPLTPWAQQALDARLGRRDAAADLVARGGVRHPTRHGPLLQVSVAGATDGAFFPALAPDAAVLLLHGPHPLVPGHHTMRLRLGLAAPPGLTLHGLGLDTLDPRWGGRWNAGSNQRGGGTAMDPEVYATALAARIEAWEPPLPLLHAQDGTAVPNVRPGARAR